MRSVIRESCKWSTNSPSRRSCTTEVCVCTCVFGVRMYLYLCVCVHVFAGCVYERECVWEFEYECNFNTSQLEMRRGEGSQGERRSESVLDVKWYPTQGNSNDICELEWVSVCACEREREREREREIERKCLCVCVIASKINVRDFCNLQFVYVSEWSIFCRYVDPYISVCCFWTSQRQDLMVLLISLTHRHRHAFLILLYVSLKIFFSKSFSYFFSNSIPLTLSRSLILISHFLLPLHSLSLTSLFLNLSFSPSAYNSQQVVYTLKKMALAGRTIICTLHQPRSRCVCICVNVFVYFVCVCVCKCVRVYVYILPFQIISICFLDKNLTLRLLSLTLSIFALFDNLICLSEGRVVYFGSAKDAVTYFEKEVCGYVFVRVYGCALIVYWLWKFSVIIIPTLIHTHTLPYTHASYTRTHEMQTGRTCSRYYNPADFIIDFALEDERRRFAAKLGRSYSQVSGRFLLWNIYYFTDLINRKLSLRTSMCVCVCLCLCLCVFMGVCAR